MAALVIAVVVLSVKGRAPGRPVSREEPELEMRGAPVHQPAAPWQDAECR